MVINMEWFIIIIITRILRNDWSPFEAQNVSSVTENKSELGKICSSVQSTTSNSLTVLSMQQSRMTSYRTGPHRSKSKPIN